jgi:DNA-binding beta-propeller fold protein YncE
VAHHNRHPGGPYRLSARRLAMTMKNVGYIDLPEHRGNGGFDHAAVHAASGHVYVAHTANDAVDVFDPNSQKFLFSVPDLPGASDVLVSDEAQLIIASNRSENTIGIFAPGPQSGMTKIAGGVQPNGLAFDAKRRVIIVANLGDPAFPGSGTTRWTLYDPDADAYYVNISDPPQIVVVDGQDPSRIARLIDIPAVGPHGLDLDLATGRLFCACDAAVLLTLEARSGKIFDRQSLSGKPDVVFFSRQHRQLYVAVGDPGVIDVFDTTTMERLATVTTEPGAHTTALAPAGDHLFAFLPASHRAAIYQVT